MKNLRWRSFSMLAILIVLLVFSVQMFGASLESRYGLGFSTYVKDEGDGTYSEEARWSLLTVRGDVSVVPSLRLVAEAQFGKTTEARVVSGAEATDLAGSLNRRWFGAELLWQPTDLFTFGGGLAYLTDEQTFTWQAKHPGGDVPPPFAPGDTLDWTWDRSVTGILGMASVQFDAGLAQVSGRIGYSPSMAWTEPTEASLADDWEEWHPEKVHGSAGMYELGVQWRLFTGWSLVGGAQGIIMQSSALDELDTKYANSKGESGTTVSYNIPGVVDNTYSFFAGVRYEF